MKNLKATSASRKESATLSIPPTQKKKLADFLNKAERKKTIQEIYVKGSDLLQPNVALKAKLAKLEIFG